MKSIARVMDPEQRSKLEETDRFMVACIDFSSSSGHFSSSIGLHTSETLDEIKEKKYQHMHCLYLVHRVRGSVIRDPRMRKLLETRMSEAVDLLKKKLEDPTIEYKKPTRERDAKKAGKREAITVAALLEGVLLCERLFLPNRRRIACLPHSSTDCVLRCIAVMSAWCLVSVPAIHAKRTYTLEEGSLDALKDAISSCPISGDKVDLSNSTFKASPS
ncbi:hypothetical protein MTO96_012187 [Rhipicephalus appendiculatus]